MKRRSNRPGYERKPFLAWSLQDVHEWHNRPQYILGRRVRLKGAFWNNKEAGYGGDEWPFSKHKAIRYIGYRQGVERASRSPIYDSVWRTAAKQRLQREVYPALRDIASAMKDAIEMDEMEAFTL